MNRTKPLIGITTDFKDKHNTIEEVYSGAVARHGGLPVLIPTVENQSEYLKSIICRIDGLLIPGSRDMDPKHYNEKPHPKLNPMNRDRTAAEFKALESALENNLPVLAICGGMQFVNVFFGGSLYQDIQDLFDKPLRHEKGAIHPVKIDRQSGLYKVLGVEKFDVNSYHHQAVNKIGKGLTVNAHSPDGIVEGFESEEHSLLAVQWHPELEDSEQSKQIFESFLSKCKHGE